MGQIQQPGSPLRALLDNEMQAAEEPVGDDEGVSRRYGFIIRKNHKNDTKHMKTNKTKQNIKEIKHMHQRLVKTS